MKPTTCGAFFRKQPGDMVVNCHLEAGHQGAHRDAAGDRDPRGCCRQCGSPVTSNGNCLRTVQLLASCGKPTEPASDASASDVPSYSDAELDELFGDQAARAVSRLIPLRVERLWATVQKLRAPRVPEVVAPPADEELPEALKFDEAVVAAVSPFLFAKADSPPSHVRASQVVALVEAGYRVGLRERSERQEVHAGVAGATEPTLDEVLEQWGAVVMPCSKGSRLDEAQQRLRKTLVQLHGRAASPVSSDTPTEPDDVAERIGRIASGVVRRVTAYWPPEALTSSDAHRTKLVDAISEAILDYLDDADHYFDCPKCGGHHFGTQNPTEPFEQAIVGCHDQFAVGCRWEGTWAEHDAAREKSSTSSGHVHHVTNRSES